MRNGTLTNVTDSVVSVIETLGAPGAGLLIALENLFPPLPSEMILPLAGFSASRGDLSLIGALIWTTIGSVVGALALYWIGAKIGRDRIRAIVDRLPLLTLEDVDRTEAWFARHGGKAVFFGRMVPLFRSLISIPAGVERMRLSLFLLYTTLGSAIWNTAFILAGYALGENWHVIEESVGLYSKIVLALAVLALAVFVVRRVRRSRSGASASSRSEHERSERSGHDHRGTGGHAHNRHQYSERNAHDPSSPGGHEHSRHEHGGHEHSGRAHNRHQYSEHSGHGHSGHEHSGHEHGRRAAHEYAPDVHGEREYERGSRGYEPR